MDKSASKILVTQTDPITTIQLNRPNVLNAIDREMLDELDATVARLHHDSSVRVVILSGNSDRAFCVGADLNQIATFGARRHSQMGHRWGTVYLVVWPVYPSL